MKWGCDEDGPLDLEKKSWFMATLETHDLQKRVKHSQRKDLSKVEAVAFQGNSRTVP